MAGAMTGGDKLLAKLARMSKRTAKRKELHVGFLSGATYPDGKSVPMIAAIQEFGAPAKNIPPRPFFRRMIAEGKSQWPEMVQKVLVAADYDVEKTYERMGRRLADDLQMSIKKLQDPPLSPRTIAARVARLKSAKRKKPNPVTIAKPLIDTGTMLRAVDYEVVDSD